MIYLVTLFDYKLYVFRIDHFWHFVYSKCKRSSLRSQCWMRLFLWFSNTVFSTQFVDEQQKCYPQRLTRLGSQPITFSKLPGKFIISRITSLGSSSNRMKKFHILCTWPKFNIDEEQPGLNDSIIIQDRFHLLCWSKMMH